MNAGRVIQAIVIAVSMDLLISALWSSIITEDTPSYVAILLYLAAALPWIALPVSILNDAE